VSTRPNRPRTLRALWCPACGALRMGEGLPPGPRKGAHVGPEGGTCTSEREVLTFHRGAGPRVPSVPGTAPWRAAVTVEATVTPALPHLDDAGEESTIVGHTVLVAGDSVDFLAQMMEAQAELLAQWVADRIAVHPRPEPYNDLIPRWPG
jgi:hypothetical protein